VPASFKQLNWWGAAMIAGDHTGARVPEPIDAVGLVLSVFDLGGVAALLTGPDGLVIDTNEVARMIMRDREFRVERGRIRCGDRQAARRLEEAIDELLSPRSCATVGGPVALPSPRGRPVLAYLRATPPFARDLASAVIVLVDLNGQSTLDLCEMMTALELTPAEARVAALVGSGRSPREASEELGVTEGTARVTLKRVYAKLDLSRQSQLAQLVARLRPVTA
jgi:DNA-binding CsgD family transcriptional regulator